MHKISLSFLFLILALGLLPSAAAWAGTDYQCLNSCVQDGKASSECLSQCRKDQLPANQSHAIKQTDYRCLNLCVNGGKDAASCLPQCSYAKTAQTKGGIASSSSASNHDILNAPTPVGSTTILAPNKPGNSGKPKKDYVCLNSCVHDGMQYDMCDQKCSDPAKTQTQNH